MELSANPEAVIAREFRALLGDRDVPAISPDTIRAALEPPDSFACEPHDLAVFWEKLFA